MPPIERLDLFAVPVFRGILPGFAEQRAGLVELLRGQLREREPGKDASSRGGFRTGDHLHRVESPAARYLARAILEFSVASLGPSLGGFAKHDLALTECWGNVDAPGTWHSPHNHYPAQWAGVVYLDAEACASPDPAERDGKLELLSPVPLPHAFAQPTGVTFTPKDGAILLFPAVLQHLVHPHREGGERVSVAFNVHVVDRR